MKSKGNTIMSKVITRKLNVGDRFKLLSNSFEIYEVVKIKDDYLIYKNVHSGEEFTMVRGFAQTVDLIDESATYQKKRFKEPAYMYNESVKPIKEAQERKKDYLAIVKRFRSDINKHIDKVERDIERGFAIDYSDRDEAQVLGTRFSAELLRYNLAVENKTLTESFVITDSINGKPTYFHYGKFTGYDWGFEKEKATKFPTKEAAERMIEKMRQEGAIVKDMKVIQEGRIARGYENLDAEEKVKHLLSHPCSKYMGDIKSGNITERAIRKAVKEMLGKPDKRAPQFIIDVNEEGEAPAVATTTANVENPELPLKLKESQDEDYVVKQVCAYAKPEMMKAKGITPEILATAIGDYIVTAPSTSDIFNVNYFAKVLDKVLANGKVNPNKFILQKVNTVCHKLFESLSSKTHKFKPEELKVGKRVIDKVGGKEVHGKITVNHNDLYKDNPYTQDKKGSTVVTIVTDSGRSYDVDANDNGGEFILENEESLENSIKYQTSVAGGMGTDAENAPSAQEHDDEVVLVREHKSFRKFLKESH